MSTADEYVLGVNAAEIERLALQHRVWRERALSLWRRAGLHAGARVLDVGCGPGWAAVDLAEIVGPAGSVLAVDRAGAFLAHARHLAKERALSWLHVREVNLPARIPVDAHVDFAWCRWVLAFNSDRPATLGAVAQAIEPGGVLAIQEYVDYELWSLSPPPRIKSGAAFDRFVETVVQSWRDDGGEPNAAKDLPKQLDAAGFDLEYMRSFADVAAPGEPMWDWAATFARSGPARLVDLGKLSATDAQAHTLALDAAEARGARMVMPITAQLIARRR